ncbi:MAG: hypothetical protein AAFO88_05460 [Pseudomonadota bacterium]
MARDIDDRKKRAALRKLRKAAALAESGLGPPLSDWEREFLEEVEARIETYGSAFGDPEKGDLDEPLSALQKVKLKEIDKKARGKGLKRGGFKRRFPDQKEPLDDRRERAKPQPKRGITPISRQAAPQPPPAKKPAPQPHRREKPMFKVIDGGKTD